MSVDMWLPFFLVILARIVNNGIDIGGGNRMKFHSIFRIKQLESLITEYAFDCLQPHIAIMSFTS